MNKVFKRIVAAGMALTLALSLTACGMLGGVTAKAASKYIQGLLDMTYLGEFNKDYMDLVDISSAEAEENYQVGLEAEAEYFAQLYSIEHLTDELMEEIVTLYKEIYSHSKYTVNDATKVDDNTFGVKVQVQPLNLFHLVDAAMEEYMADFFAKYEDVDFNAMTEAEYEAYDAEWAGLLIALCKEKLPEIGYLEETSLMVQFTKDDNDIWGIPDDDFSNLDYLIIDYNIK